ncbi:MAG: hypothetical protein ACC660_08080, partial [Acidimicrobiales bacterium]
MEEPEADEGTDAGGWTRQRIALVAGGAALVGVIVLIALITLVSGDDPPEDVSAASPTATPSEEPPVAAPTLTPPRQVTTTAQHREHGALGVHLGVRRPVIQSAHRGERRLGSLADDDR